jgi:large subunit ribosomal protein L20
MSRVKRGPIPRRRHNRVFKQTEGFVGSRKNRYREAVRVLFKSWEYAYVGRKLRKRDFRTLWIQRINAACRVHGMSYSRFIAALKASEIELDRKVLADMAVTDPTAFGKLVELTSKAIAPGQQSSARSASAG